MKSKVKCVVWDLDNTVWDGTLLENNDVKIRPYVLKTIKELDQRGILQSIASRNEYEHAFNKLRELNIENYFLYPQIHWSNKSSSIETIASQLNIGIDTLAFIDDQPFERDEVKSIHAQVETYSHEEINNILENERFIPKFVTDETAQRRQMYLSDIKRKEYEERFEGSNEEFLSSLNMRFVIHRATVDDLERAEELTIRTNQLNTTGKTYDYNDLREMLDDPKHEVLVTSLEDNYGNYGKIGLALIQDLGDRWRLKLLLMSCRVMSRGIGTTFINYIRLMARKNKVNLYADFVKNEKNRMLYMTYRFLGFNEVTDKGLSDMLIDRGETIPNPPEYLIFDAPENIFY